MLLKQSSNKINEIEFEYTTFKSNNMLTINHLNNQINQKDCDIASLKKTIDTHEKTIVDNKNYHSKLQDEIENEIKQKDVFILFIYIYLFLYLIIIILFNA
jgi:hypothetical protein